MEDLKCKQHPRYRGIYRHRTICDVCDAIYFENHRGDYPVDDDTQATADVLGFVAATVIVVGVALLLLGVCS